MVELPVSTRPVDTAADPEMGIDITVDGGVPQVRLRGEIDLSNATALSDQLSALASRGGDVVVDLSEIDFLGVAGLDAMCSAARTLGARDDRLLVRSPPKLVERIIEVLALEDLLPIVRQGPLPSL